MKVLLLTDSLSLPRSEDQQKVIYEDTYPVKLRNAFPAATIVDSAIGGATILDLYKQVFYYKNVQPDVVILHCGIVDCAPRAWRSAGRKLQAALGLKLNGLTRFMRKHRGLKLTPPGKFAKISGQLKLEFPNIPIYAIGILPASAEYEKQVPGITRSIQQYNEILAKNFTLVSNADFPISAIMPDHHHLNQQGHDLIFQKIRSVLLNYDR